MEPGGLFRFLAEDEFKKLTQAEKMVYLQGATAELMRRGEDLRKFSRHLVEKPEQPK